MSKYESYATCEVCKYSFQDTFGATVYNNPHIKYPCSQCGNTHIWEDEVKKWVSDSIWYKPQTWGTGHWVYPEGK